METEKIRRKSPVPLDKCGVFLAANLIGDRWTLLILREAFYGVVRFDDIRSDLGIPRAVLAARLKLLVEANVMNRAPYREEGSRTRYAYTLTEQGKSLGPVIIALMQWGDNYLRDDQPPICLVDAKTGATLKVALVDEGSESVPIEDIRIKIGT